MLNPAIEKNLGDKIVALIRDWLGLPDTQRSSSKGAPASPATTTVKPYIPLPDWQPFPVDALPAPWDEFARQGAISNEYNDGARTLKNYLRYAEALSAGNSLAARRVLSEINPAQNARIAAQANHIVVDELAARLRQRGYEVDLDVGQSGFRCDLAIRSLGQLRYCMGIMVDTESYYQNDDLLERDLLRPRLLRTFDWSIILVLTKDWFDNADVVMQFIEQKIAGIGPQPTSDSS